MLRKIGTFEWTEQCENAFQLLKTDLTKIPALQYPNPNKPFKLFTDTSKHSYSRILHEEKEGQADTDEPELIPIAYFSGMFNKTQQLWNTIQKECYAVYRSVQKFAFYLTGTDFTLHCNHKPLTPFFTIGMSSHILDWWALEPQQFNIKFEHIQGKKNLVADVISRLKTSRLHQDYNDEGVKLSLEYAIENTIEEIYDVEPTPNVPTYTKIDKLNLNLLRREQLCNKLCKMKVKESNTKPDPSSF